MRHLAGRRWQQIKVQIVHRQVPHTVMSWRFLLPGQPLAVRLHRRVFCGAWPTLPRWVWGMMVLYASGRWFTYQCWGQILRALRHHSQTTWERFQIPWRTQLLDLVRLAVLHSIPPHFYYHYGLFRQPRRHWLQYIYTHELPHWHAVLSPGLSPPTRHVLTDKQAFAAVMARHGIPTVPTLHFLPQGHPVAPDTLFAHQAYFWKPTSASRSEGCFALRYDPARDTYRLLTLITEEVLDDRTAIHAYVTRQVEKQDYLVQPLLANHPCLGRLCQTTQLVTLRVVTGLDRHQPVVLYATLEIPRSPPTTTWWLVMVDCQTGRCLDTPGRRLWESDEQEEAVSRLRDRPLPFWSHAVEMCIKAHRHCPDLLTIGWDVAMTTTGPIVLEGNINWGVAGPQILAAEPALSGPLGRLYQRGACGDSARSGVGVARVGARRPRT